VPPADTQEISRVDRRYTVGPRDTSNYILYSSSSDGRGVDLEPIGFCASPGFLFLLAVEY